MSEMVERIAKAICAGDAWPRQADIARTLARAALEAMREPTNAMIAAIENKAEERYQAAPDMQRFYGDDLWRAGIDEAVK
jgi:hypothetical protein